MPRVAFCHSSSTLSPVSTEKSSGLLKPRWRRLRMTTRAWSWAGSKLSIERAWIMMSTERRFPYIFWK